jgi:hypothetical protein
MNVALVQLKWSVHARDQHKMIDPTALSTGTRLIELRGEDQAACEQRVADVIRVLLEEMKADGVECTEECGVPRPQVRGMR